MRANEPSNYLKVVLQKYAANHSAIEGLANKSNIKVAPKHLMAIAAITTLLDFLSTGAKSDEVIRLDDASNIHRLRDITQKIKEES